MSATAVGQFLLGLACILALARVFGTLAKLIGQPPVIGEVLAGILLGPTLFGTLVSDHLFPAEARPALGGLADLGLVLFMFIIGYELDTATLRERKRMVISVSIGSIAVPLGSGIALALWLAHHHSVTDIVPFALFIGAAMAVTAFPVLARILLDRGMLRTEVGGLALTIAAVGDVAAWSLLAVVVSVGAAEGATFWQLLLAIPYALVMLYGVRPLLRRLADARQLAGQITPNAFGVILVGLLLSSYATDSLGLHAIFGAFLFGAVMPRTRGDVLRHEMLERLEQISVLLLLPVFFVLAGLQVDLSAMDGTALLELLVILLVAIGGKFVGVFAAARLHRVGVRHAAVLAVLMNTRGLTEIVILTVGLQLGILDGRLFSMMVVMALVTTMMAGPLLALIYPSRLVERDILRTERGTLGATPAYRVLAVVPPTKSGAPLVGLAAELAGTQRPAEVILSLLLPQSTAPLEVGSGLFGELLAMRRTMEELVQLAEPLRARGLDVPVLARFSTDPTADLRTQVVASDPDVVVTTLDQPGHQTLADSTSVPLVTVVAQPPQSWGVVFVRAPGDADGEAALRLGSQLAAARGAPLVIDAGSRPPRRLVTAVQELNQHGVRARFDAVAPPSALVVAVTGDAHLLVRGQRVTRARPLRGRIGTAAQGLPQTRGGVDRS